MKSFFFQRRFQVEGAPRRGSSQEVVKEIQAALLLEAYRNRAHLVAQTNPIRPRKDRNPGLDPALFGLGQEDLTRVFAATGGKTLAQSLADMQACYGGSLGFEFQHIREKEIRDWCRDYFENRSPDYGFDLDKKKRILQKPHGLGRTEAVGFDAQYQRPVETSMVFPASSMT